MKAIPKIIFLSACLCLSTAGVQASEVHTEGSNDVPVTVTKDASFSVTLPAQITFTKEELASGSKSYNIKCVADLPSDGLVTISSKDATVNLSSGNNSIGLVNSVHSNKATFKDTAGAEETKSASYTVDSNAKLYAGNYTVNDTFLINVTTTADEYADYSGQSLSDWEYTVESDDAIALTKYIGSGTRVYVPTTLDGKTVNRLSNLDTGDAEELVVSDIGLHGQNHITTGNKDNLAITFNDWDVVQPGILQNNTKVQTVNLNSCTSIGSAAFSGCTNLATVNGTENVTIFNNMAFANCSSLDNLKLSSAATYGGRVTPGCTALTNVTWVDSDSRDGYSKLSIFTEDSPYGASYVLGTYDGIKYTTDYMPYLIVSWDSKVDVLDGTKVFSALYAPMQDSYRYHLKSVSFPSSLVKIIDGAFQYMWGLDTELKLPSNLKELGAVTFTHAYSCPNSTITIPRSVKAIGRQIGDGIVVPDHQFYMLGRYAGKFKSYVVEDGNENYTTNDGILYTKDLSTIVAIPTNKVFPGSTYKMPEGTVTCGGLGLSGNTSVKAIQLSDTFVIDNDWYNTVKKCTLNTSSNLLQFCYQNNNVAEFSVKSSNARYSAFNGCIYSKDGTELVSVPWKHDSVLQIKPGCTTVDKNAFWYHTTGSYGVTKLSVLIIPSSLQSIDEETLAHLNKSYITADTDIVFPDGSQYYTVDSNNKIVAGSCESNLATSKTFAEYAQYKAQGAYGTSLSDWNSTEVTYNTRVLISPTNSALGEVTYVPYYIFDDSGVMYKCKVQSKLLYTQFGAEDNVKTLVVGTGYTSLPDSFAENRKETTILLPTTCNTLGDACFAGNNRATCDLTYLTKIGDGAFSLQCGTYTIPDTLTAIGYDAFSGCSIHMNTTHPLYSQAEDEYAYWDASVFNDEAVN